MRGDPDHTLKPPLTNVLVDGDGHVRIAGFGTAFIPSTMPAVDIVLRRSSGTD